MNDLTYNRSMVARLTKSLIVIALVITTGLHWAALQTVAWATMLASNLRTHSMCEAVSDTFDGKHPCPICLAIAAAKKSEKKSEAFAKSLKFEFPPVAEKFYLISPKPESVFSLADFSADSYFLKPPVPPPRSLFV